MHIQPTTRGDEPLETSRSRPLRRRAESSQPYTTLDKVIFVKLLVDESARDRLRQRDANDSASDTRSSGLENKNLPGRKKSRAARPLASSCRRSCQPAS